ncbi:hypothetical protein Vretifemale_17490 [Volvox reticuliferus]|uniref:RING-CH-type domain-containing protein n=1 Tax=Volvox reticuliferus TaxID=1737510 RepID=A0A8J4FWM7_9CHLO|nr:hypothetical protein Vretifemale_17490 [Volvox reticuliferus]
MPVRQKLRTSQNAFLSSTSEHKEAKRFYFKDITVHIQLAPFKKERKKSLKILSHHSEMVAVASVGLSPSSCPTQRRYTGSDSDVDECWICLSSEPPGTLARVCDCPRVSHRECLARWQLTNYGRR